MTRMLMGEGGEVHFWIRRIPLKDVPCDTVEETSNWCKKVYQEKDEGMSYFMEHGRFPAESCEYPRKTRNLITCIVWSIILGLPLLWYIVSVIISGSVVSLLIAGIIALIGYIMVKVLLHFSDSKKGSSFGLKTSNLSSKKQSWLICTPCTLGLIKCIFFNVMFETELDEYFRLSRNIWNEMFENRNLLEWNNNAEWNTF